MCGYIPKHLHRHRKLANGLKGLAKLGLALINLEALRGQPIDVGADPPFRSGAVGLVEQAVERDGRGGNRKRVSLRGAVDGRRIAAAVTEDTDATRRMPGPQGDAIADDLHIAGTNGLDLDVDRLYNSLSIYDNGGWQLNLGSPVSLQFFADGSAAYQGPSGYAVPFTAAELARLEAIFPTGVCDWSKPTGDYRPTKGTWVSFGPAGSKDEDEDD